jgi:predicted ATPase/class 3 adenylate cyclase/Tfp pilus assembly protein PilF
MPDLPTGTVTFLFTDIEGSTRLLQRLGPDYARVLGEHQALLRAAFAAHAGAEVDTQGDAFFAAFATAQQALAAAVAATRALAASAWPEDGVVRVRMGLHTGSPQLVGDHYVGLDVHRAARIASAGHGGQILLSDVTRRLVENALPEGLSLRDLGPHRLKDLQQSERLYQVIIPSLPADFPPLKTLDRHKHNLPSQPTPLLDRMEPRATLTAWLRHDARLATLTGPGGIGKTRLAIQVAAELVDDFADGVWLVRLSRLTDPALVIPTIAQSLGLKETSGQSLAELLRAYVADKRLLLVLDNFEQVVGAAAEIADLLGASQGLRALVTSRAPLRLRGEREYPLVPLALPDMHEPPSPDRLSQYAALALFIERASAARPDFTVTTTNAPAIAEICARLDGLPLAIELAAARVKLLPPEALLARLSSRLGLLTGGARDLEPRQQTMRAAIAWSEQLLTPAEQALFQRMAVFVDGCALEAAEAICATPEGAAPLELDLLDGLSMLVDHSLVRQREEGGEPRFGMLHVIREYALERLETSDGGREAEALRRAHAVYYLALIEQAEPELAGPDAAVWLGRLEREHDNLRAALSWARERGEVETGLRLVSAAGRFWATRGYLREGRAWVESMLALENTASGEQREQDAGEAGATGSEESGSAGASQAVERGRARAFRAGGTLAMWQGDYAVAARWLEQAVSHARMADDLRTAAAALRNLGSIAEEQDDMERASKLEEESLAIAREIGDQIAVASALNSLGIIAWRQGDLERAGDRFTDALALARALGDQQDIGTYLGNVGAVTRQRGELAQAEAMFREALALYRELGDPLGCAQGLENLANTAAAAGQPERATRLAGAAMTIRERIAVPQSPANREDMEPELAAARAALGEAAWAGAYAAGRTLTLEQAIAEALGESGEIDA